jgi:hypothetical protein
MEKVMPVRNIGQEHLHKEDAVHYESDGRLLVELSLAEEAVNMQQNILQGSIMILKHLMSIHNIEDEEVLKFINFLENNNNE